MKRAPLLLTLAFLAAAREAHAISLPDNDTKALPCRPTIACTADIVKPGLFELETGVLFRRLGGTSDPSDTRQWSFPFLAKLTLATFAQLQVGSNGYTAMVDAVPPNRLFGDVTIGMKFHLLDQGPIVPSVSLSAAFGQPVESAQATDAFAIAYASKDFGFLHVDLNFGLNDLGLNGSEAGQEWVALSFSVALPAPFSVMLENYLFSDAAPQSAHDGGCLFALALTPKPWLVFDFGGDIGYFADSRVYSTFVGMTIVPVRLWP